MPTHSASAGSTCTALARGFRRRRRGGFSLLEAMVSIIMLVLIMIVAMSLLFTMRSFAERQQFFTAPRQSARRAMEYVAAIAESATDMNFLKNSPNALPTQVRYDNGGKNTTYLPINVAYNNLEGDELSWHSDADFHNAPRGTGAYLNKYTLFGDAGTDIVTLFQPIFDLQLPITSWTGNDFASAQMYVDFEDGCPDDDLNLELFKQKIGWNGSESQVLQYKEGDGQYYYIQITNLSPSSSDCNESPLYHETGPSPTCTPKDPFNPCPVIHIVANPGGSPAQVNPPGGFRPPQSYPITLALGSRIFTFRIRTPLDADCVPTGPPALEQKMGLFQPELDRVECGDSPANYSFTPIVEGIEDLQTAWIYFADPSDPVSGTELIWGSATNPLPQSFANPDPDDALLNPTMHTYGVPPQIGNRSQTNGTQLCPALPPYYDNYSQFPLDPRDLDTGKAGYSAVCAYDVRYVRGLRVSFTGRSELLTKGSKEKTQAGGLLSQTFRPESNFRPTSEDHASDATTGDGYDHYRMTTTVMIRNRMLGY